MVKTFFVSLEIHLKNHKKFDSSGGLAWGPALSYHATDVTNPKVQMQAYHVIFYVLKKISSFRDSIYFSTSKKIFVFLRIN